MPDALYPLMTTQVPRRTGRATLETMTTAPHSAPIPDDDTAAEVAPSAPADEWPAPDGQWDEPD